MTCPTPPTSANSTATYSQCALSSTFRGLFFPASLGAPACRGPLLLRVDRPRPVLLVERHEGEQPFGDLDVGRAAVAGSHDLDPNCHRSAADAFHPGGHADPVGQGGRRAE